MKRKLATKPKTKRKRKTVNESNEQIQANIDAMEVIKAKEDKEKRITLEITRPGDGQSLNIYIKAPILADVVRKMTPGNYNRADYASIYLPILLPLVDATKGEIKDRVVTRPAVAKITKNFVPGSDFAWDAPRACIIYNPAALAAGLTLVYKVTEPVPPDQIRRWGKMFMDGCNDIIANARPFKMSWIMDELPQVQGKAPF